MPGTENHSPQADFSVPISSVDWNTLESSLAGSPLRQALPIAVSKQLLLFRRERRFVQEGQSRAARPILVGIIGGEENALRSNKLQCTLQVRLTPHPTWSHVQIFPNVIGDGPSEPCNTRE